MLSEQDEKLARLAVEKRYLTHNQLTDCVAFKRDRAPSVPLDQVFVEQGYLTFEETEELLHQSSDAPLFASLLREQGLATDAEIRDALRRKHELASRNIHRYVGEILVERGVISTDHVDQILARQGRQSMVCKACGYRYNARHDSGYACPECSRLISDTQARVSDDRIGPYVRKEELGRGSTGKVYRAVNPERGQEAALKIISGSTFGRPYLDRCLARARDISLIHHPNLAGVLDAGTHGDSIYIASEFVEGLTLRDHVLGNIRLPLEEAIGILKQVAAGLEAAHQRDLVHGNLTPDNILITELREVRLTDLGLAREISGLPVEEVRELGNLIYSLAPERWTRRAAPPGDFYACGALWYFMLTGVQPFEAPTFEEVRRAHRDLNPPPPSKRVPELPPGADALFIKLTYKDPSLRYRHSAELLADLDRLERGEPTQSEREMAPPAEAPRRRKAPSRRNRRR